MSVKLNEEQPSSMAQPNEAPSATPNEAPSAPPRVANRFQEFGYIVLWVVLSAGVIMFNKYILDPDLGGFPFPLTLTCIHMAFCSAASFTAVHLHLVNAIEIPFDTILRCIFPIGVLFALTLWMGNAAYLYLSVSFIQMLKASMPMLVYCAGICFGIEKLCGRTVANLAVVVCGVMLASYGEIVFIVVGVAYQCASLITEATRLSLVQILLQKKGFKLNPIMSMYYIAPVSLFCLFVLFLGIEAEELFEIEEWPIGPVILLCSAMSAFALNVAVFLLVGSTSALTMNVAGVIKDVLLILLSMALYRAPVSNTQFVGYGIALTGVFIYNYSRIKGAAPKPNEIELERTQLLHEQETNSSKA